MALDFTSSLYLGIRHTSDSLRPWTQLTTGVPAALSQPTIAKDVAYKIARLQGCEQGMLSRSTFHLFWDLFGMLSNEQVAIYLDAGAYPIARWGVERAKGRGLPVHRFPHHAADGLRRLLRRRMSSGRPIVVCDGICTACGCATPIADYLEVVRAYGGLLVIDDTQALGLLGDYPNTAAPYGRGGGGSLRQQTITGAEVLSISSLAKSFGAPLAALCGSESIIGWFESRSETRLHCSPPSLADIHAAGRALSLNAVIGDRLRLQLAARVHYFRDQLARLGLATDGGLFPVQTLQLPSDVSTIRIHQCLLASGIQTILRNDCNGRGTRISFIITARHQPDEIGRAVGLLSRAVKA